VFLWGTIGRERRAVHAVEGGGRSMRRGERRREPRRCAPCWCRWWVSGKWVWRCRSGACPWRCVCPSRASTPSGWRCWWCSSWSCACSCSIGSPRCRTSRASRCSTPRWWTRASRPSAGWPGSPRCASGSTTARSPTPASPRGGPPPRRPAGLLRHAHDGRTVGSAV